MPLNQTQIEILNIIKRSQNILILPSSPIDGDSLGSSLSLYIALKKIGKNATVIAEEKVPKSYEFLPSISTINRELNFVREFIVTIDCRENAPETVRHEVQGNKINVFITPTGGSIAPENISVSPGQAPYDCIITVDAADPSQFGSVYENAIELFQMIPVINIDHHASNASFGRINHVDVMAASTTMMILPLIEELGTNLMDADIATLLLTGLITDTGSFQNPNTTPDAFAIAAKLIGMGARQQEIIRHIYKTKRLSTLRLWGRTLTKLQYDDERRMVWSVLTAKDFAEVGSTPDQTEGVIDELMSNAPGAEIIFLLKEKGRAHGANAQAEAREREASADARPSGAELKNEISGSIRTYSSSIDASKLAMIFGGGGHVQAAGFKMHGKTIEEAEKEVVEAFRNFQIQRLRLPEATQKIGTPLSSASTTMKQTTAPAAPLVSTPPVPSTPAVQPASKPEITKTAPAAATAPAPQPEQKPAPVFPPQPGL